MQMGLGWLAWTPETFWASTMPELLAACAGTSERLGGGKTQPLTRAELEDLMEEYPD